MKKITIPEIARLTNVSIGTVDRAINNRPGINPKTKEKILAIADRHNYSPNRLSKALANNKTVNIGMITLPESIPFVEELIDSAQREAASLFDYGCRLTIKSLKNFDAEEEIKIIHEFIDNGIDALAIEGLDHPAINEKINLAAQKGIPTVTFNTDVPRSKRMCFVGQNLIQSGKIAADLLCRFMGGTGDLYVLQGYHEVAAHSERLQGFLAIVEKEFPRVNIVKIDECYDDNKTAFKKTGKILQDHPGISGIYVVASGNIGAAKAVSKKKTAHHINFVCNDYVNGIKEFLDQDIIDATILQDPKTQGSLPINILFEAVFDNITPARKIVHTHIQIITKHHDFRPPPDNSRDTTGSDKNEYFQGRY